MTFNNHGEYYTEVITNNEREKPVVHYSKHIEGWPIEIGESAGVVPIDHPAIYLNGRAAYTSYIVNIAENGVDFETRNTKYVYKPEGELNATS